jgi:ribonuclease PH
MEASEEGKISCEIKFAPFATRVGRSFSENREQELSSLIIQSLLPCVQRSLFPKSVLDLRISVLQDDGCVAAAAVTAAAAALAHAGVPMNDIVTACSVSKVCNMQEKKECVLIILFQRLAMR